MAIEGELVVRIATAGGRVTRAEARAERPRVAGRLFRGRPAAEAAPLAGTLFAICGRSQAIAAAAAVGAARGEAGDEALGRARDLRIGAETVQEHAWRLLVDWPRLAGLAPDVAALAEARQCLAPLLEADDAAQVTADAARANAWARDRVLGRDAAAFAAMDSLGSLEAWTREADTTVAAFLRTVLADDPALGAADTPFLPRGEAGGLAQALAAAIDADAAFDDRPHWNGEARETGPLARTAAHPLVADALANWGRGVGSRIVARLVDLAQVLAAMAGGTGARHGAAATGARSGLAWVETARGLLVHRVALDGERIGAYRIVAPTEWNFHPAGAFTRGALGLARGDAAGLEAGVRRLVASLDPCVGVRYESGHA